MFNFYPLIMSKGWFNAICVPDVQEVVTLLYSKLVYKIGDYFLDIQYLR